MRSKQYGIKYRNDNDKAYGVAGMALGLAVFDVSALSRGIDMDAVGFECLQFAPDFFFEGNPLMSAKDSWKHTYSHFQVIMGLSIANAMCRKMLLDHGSIDRKMRLLLLEAACNEGMLACQLEKEEVERLFDKYYSHLLSVFSNREIAQAVSEFATIIRQERTITRQDMEEFFSNVL
jgi:hypothetical protein